MARPLIITGTLLRNLVTCERRVWLDAYGRADDRVAVNPVGMQYGVEHENIIQTAAGAIFEEQTGQAPSWDQAVEATREMMREGIAEIIGAVVEHRLESRGMSVTLRGQIDRLTRTEGGLIYEPIEIKQYDTPAEADFLQLELYIIILQQMQKTQLKGYFWLGKDSENHPRTILPHRLDAACLKEILWRVNRVLSMRGPPPVRLEPHCQQCPWNAACMKVAHSALDLGLLHRLSKRSRVYLESQGVTNLRQFAVLSVEQLQRVEGIKSSAAALRANARAFVENRPVWLNTVPDTLHQGGWMFDLETMALPGGDGLPWSLGWSDEQGVSQIAVVAPGQNRQTVWLPSLGPLTVVPDKDEAWNVFYECVSANDKPIYHWSPFDANLMQKTAPVHVRQALLWRMHDLHRTFINTVRLPLKSYSIGNVATYLGFRWSGYAEWWEAETDYRRWLASWEYECIARACGYQRDDVLAVAIVLKWLMQNRDGATARE